MNLNEIKNARAEEDVIVDPNLARSVNSSSDLQEVDPAKLRGLKTAKQIEEENRPGSEFTDILNDGIDAINKAVEENRELGDVAEQSEHELSGEEIEAVKGFDPIAMMANPPKLNKTQIKKDVLDGRSSVAENDEDTAADIPTIKNEEVDTTPASDVQIDEDEEAVLNDLEDEDAYVSDRAKEKPSTPDPDSTVEKEKEIREATAMVEMSDEDFEAEILKEIEEAGDDDDEDTNLEDERLKELRDQIREKISPIAAPFDITHFTISKKPTSIKNTVVKAQVKHARVADWDLPASKLHVTMEGLLGDEITSLASRAGRNNVQGIRDQYKIFYDHIIDANKPESLDAWLKIVSVLDVDHLYAAAYRASFENMNFIPYDCPAKKCEKSFLTDNVPFMELTKFKSPEDKASFMRLVDGEAGEGSKLYVSEVIQLSETFAIVIKEPSIYDAVIRPAYLDAEFRSKYSTILTIAPYIDDVYYIDAENRELRPIRFMNYPNNIAKTEKARAITLDKVIKTLTADQYYLLISYINKISEANSPVSYIMPETTCPYCGEKIKEENMTAANLLFLRHQLAALANG